MPRNQINLQKSANSLLNWFLHTRSTCIDNEPFFVKEMIAGSVSSSYKCLNPGDFSTCSFRSSISKIDYEKYKDPFLKPVLEIASFIRKNAHSHLRGFILHGSLATLDYVPGWSDFDSIAIIRDKTLEDPSEMIRLRAICQTIEHMIKNLDKHQHHGIHFIAEKDLLMYPDLYLPTSLFEQSVSLLGSLDLSGFK
jgi:hypothetical protein